MASLHVSSVVLEVVRQFVVHIDWRLNHIALQTDAIIDVHIDRVVRSAGDVVANTIGIGVSIGNL